MLRCAKCFQPLSGHTCRDCSLRHRCLDGSCGCQQYQSLPPAIGNGPAERTSSGDTRGWSSAPCAQVRLSRKKLVMAHRTAVGFGVWCKTCRLAVSRPTTDRRMLGLIIARHSEENVGHETEVLPGPELKLRMKIVIGQPLRAM